MALSKALFFGVAERFLPFASTIAPSIIVRLGMLDRALDGCSPGKAWHLSPWSPFAPRISRSALGNEGNRADNARPFPWQSCSSTAADGQRGELGKGMEGDEERGTPALRAARPWGLEPGP
ncbi:hypothetical protein V8C44DRAFT_219233 [Trichoderma aethiopicum]